MNFDRLQRHAREVTEMLEEWAHATIWRTSLRMFELLRKKHPEIAKRNPFLSDFQRFIIPVAWVTVWGLLSRTKMDTIAHSWDFYEEWEDHPILYTDTLQSSIQMKVGLFFELTLYDLLDEWWNLDDALLIVSREVQTGELMVRESHTAKAYHPGMLTYFRLPQAWRDYSREEPKLLLAV